jgi:hypothetical protein
MCPDATLGQSWPAGTNVKAIRKTGDFYAGGTAVSSSKVSSDGTVSFKGLDEGRYWAVGEVNDTPVVVSFTAKETPAAKTRVEAPKSADPQRTPQAFPVGVEIQTGPKGTKVAGRLTEEPVGKGVEPHPHINQASVPGTVPQRSNTLLGQGTPVDPGEPQPKPRQQDVKKGTPQRSDTEFGEATPITDEAGVVRQEDFKGAQRSDTETGECARTTGRSRSARSARRSVLSRRGPRSTAGATRCPGSQSWRRRSRVRASGPPGA